MNWSRIASKFVSLGIVALSMAFMTSCGGEGGGGDEVVYLYVYNGYAGSKAMSLYGPSGKVITGLGYGESSGDPIAVDRNLGTNFKLVIDGSPQTIDLSFTLYSLYPHETGTLLLKKRSETAAADVALYRHVQSVSKDLCRIVFDNALSLDNEGLGYFGFIPMFTLPNSESGGYLRSEPSARTGLLDRIDANPIFVFVPHYEIQGVLMKVYAGPGTLIDFRTGQILTDRPSEEYTKCVNSAGGDPIQIAICAEQQTYTTHVYQPSDTTQQVIEYPKGSMVAGAPNSCNVNVRIESEFDNIFRDGKLIVPTEFKYLPGNHMFWILYGRPVDPDILAFSTDEDGYGYVELPPYPGQ